MKRKLLTHTRLGGFFVAGKFLPPKSFREFVESPPLRGLGEKLEDIERLIADDAESLVRLRELVVAGRGGDRKSENIKANNQGMIPMFAL